MGCCGESTTDTQFGGKKRNNQKGPVSRANTGDLLQVDEMVQQQRRLTRAERES